MQKIFLTLAAVCLSLNCLVAPAFADEFSINAECPHERFRIAYDVHGCGPNFDIVVSYFFRCADCGLIRECPTGYVPLLQSDLNEGLSDISGPGIEEVTFNGISVPFGESYQLVLASILEKIESGSPVDVYDLNGQLFLYSEEYDAYFPVSAMCALPNSDVSADALSSDELDPAAMIDELNTVYGYDFTLDSPLSHVYLAIMGVEADVVFTFHASESSVISVVSEVFTAAIGWAGTVAGTVSSQPLLLMGVVFGFLGIGVSLFRRSSVA